jgi:hypothetical protein
MRFRGRLRINVASGTQQDDVGLFNGVKVAKLSRMLTPILRLRYLPTLPSEEWLINLVTVMLQPRYTYDELVKMSDRVRKGYAPRPHPPPDRLVSTLRIGSCATSENLEVLLVYLYYLDVVKAMF